VKEIAALFNASGISTETMLGIERVVWGKLVVNAAVNPVTAIMGVTNGQALQLPEVYKLIHSAVNEACSVAKARGIQLPWSNPADVVVEVLQKTAANRSSMLQDVMRGEETEIDAINGAIIREAEKLGVSVPINEMLRDVIKSPSNMAKFRSQVLVGGFRL
jgi:2-dehydropantoate 2-reductase